MQAAYLDLWVTASELIFLLQFILVDQVMTEGEVEV